MINKKYIVDHLKPCLLVLLLAIICGVCYKKGKESVENSISEFEKDAISLGYASEKDGKVLFKSRRAIEQGE